jgi:hypothetical protein
VSLAFGWRGHRGFVRYADGRRGDVDERQVLEEYLTAIRELQPARRLYDDELLKAARAGDQASRRVVIECLLEITALLAIRYAPERLRILDAIQEANVVLCRLVDDTSCPDPVLRLTPAIKERLDVLGLVGHQTP